MSGAGKTEASALFGANGYTVLNCDEAVRKKLTAGSACLQEVKERFPVNIVSSDGGLDRKKTASVIFNDCEKKLIYEKIVFPYISYTIINEITDLIKKGVTDILLDAPTLFESGTDSLCNKIVSLGSNRDTAIDRIMKRDGITREEASLRISSQKYPEFFKNHSDYYIENNNSKDRLEKKIMEIINELRRSNG